MSELTVTGIDNRGDQTTAFGFVYFSDGVRVGFSREGIWASRGWGPVQRQHFALAESKLRERGWFGGNPAGPQPATTS